MNHNTNVFTCAQYLSVQQTCSTPTVCPAVAAPVALSVNKVTPAKGPSHL